MSLKIHYGGTVTNLDKIGGYHTATKIESIDPWTMPQFSKKYIKILS